MVKGSQGRGQGRDSINNNSDIVVCRYANLNDSSCLRAQKLEDSKKLQQFLRDAEEVSMNTNLRTLQRLSLL